jgi:hypothetical protein
LTRLRTLLVAAHGKEIAACGRVGCRSPAFPNPPEPRTPRRIVVDMRLVLSTILVLFLGGCSMVRFYLEQTEGISPAKLVPLYFQEQQYVNDQTLAAKVRGALEQVPALRGADIEVDVYKSAVTLRGQTTSPSQTQVAVQTPVRCSASRR